MALIDWLKSWPLAGLIAGALTATATAAAATAGGDVPGSAAASPYGAYLAGRHAQEEGSYRAAARWYEEALRADPQSAEVISRTFLMEADDGHFNEAVPLAEQALKLDSSDAVADLVLLVDSAKAGDKAAALARAEALPDDGLHRYVGPLARAWTRMGMGNLPGAEAALHDLDKFDGFAPLEYFQLAMIYDFAGNGAKAEEYYKKTLDATGQLNWRLTDAMANFYERHGRNDEAQAVYQRFVKENAGSELAETVQDYKPSGVAAPLVGSAVDGLAESLFDLASVVNRPETVELALIYDRSALELRPHLTVAQLLLADILTDQDKPEQSLAILTQIPAELALRVVGAAARRRQSRSPWADRPGDGAAPGDGGKGAQMGLRRDSARRPLARAEALCRSGRRLQRGDQAAQGRRHAAALGALLQPGHRL